MRRATVLESLIGAVQMDEGLQAIEDTLGPDIDERDAKSALWQFYFVAEDAIAYLLGPLRLSSPTDARRGATQSGQAQTSQ